VKPGGWVEVENVGVAFALISPRFPRQLINEVGPALAVSGNSRVVVCRMEYRTINRNNIPTS
jgi:hypothetical protein